MRAVRELSIVVDRDEADGLGSFASGVGMPQSALRLRRSRRRTGPTHFPPPVHPTHPVQEQGRSKSSERFKLARPPSVVSLNFTMV